MHVIAAFPESGAGEDCPLDAPDDCGVPIGTPIELRLDRYLLPSSVSRQAVTIFTGAPTNGLFVAPSYDVLERVVTFRPAYGSQLTPGVVYQVELTLPDQDMSGSGLRAFDGAPLEKGRIPLKWSFRTSRVGVQPVAAPPAPSCAEAVKTLADGGCARCHTGRRDSPMGLDLASTGGLERTAVAHVAHEASNWATPGSALGAPPRFGSAMTILSPGNPSASYLLYKLLVNPKNFGGDGACATTHQVRLPAGECLVASEDERDRLEGWFVSGDPMPPGEGALPGGVRDLQTLIGFIQSSTSQCQ